MLYHGKFGFVSAVDKGHGIWGKEIVERTYYGNLKRVSWHRADPQSMNPGVNISNQISVMTDAFLNDNFPDLKWVEFRGKKWAVMNVEVEPPRIVITLGDIYVNGKQ